MQEHSSKKPMVKWQVSLSCFPNLEGQHGVIVAFASAYPNDQILAMSFAFETLGSEWKCTQRGTLPRAVGRLCNDDDEFEYAFDLVTEKPRFDWESKTRQSDVEFFGREISRHDGPFRVASNSSRVRCLFSSLLHSSDKTRMRFERWMSTIPDVATRKELELILDAASATYSFE